MPRATPCIPTQAITPPSRAHGSVHLQLQFSPSPVHRRFTPAPLLWHWPLSRTTRNGPLFPPPQAPNSKLATCRCASSLEGFVALTGNASVGATVRGGNAFDGRTAGLRALLDRRKSMRVVQDFNLSLINSNEHRVHGKVAVYFLAEPERERRIFGSQLRVVPCVCGPNSSGCSQNVKIWV